MRRILLLAFGCLIALPAISQLSPAELAKMQLQLKTADSLNKLSSQLLLQVSQKLSQVTPTPPVDTAYVITEFDDKATEVTYTNTWTEFSKADLYRGKAQYATALDATSSLRFYGVKADFYTEVEKTHGIAAISVDGGAERDVDTYLAGDGKPMKVYSTGLLKEGWHTLKIRVKNQKSAASSGVAVVVDKFVTYRVTDIPPPIPPDPPVGGFDFIISPNGSAAIPGTVQAPTSLAAALAAAKKDQVIAFTNGTYRVTVVPPVDGVVFTNYTGHTPVISGLEQVNTSWTVHSGQIYKTRINLPVNGYNQTISSNTTLAANQLFKDGVMQIEARWPDAPTVEELFNRNNLRQRNSVANWTATSITDNGMPQISGGWTGGKVWITGWFIAQTRTIKSNSGTTIGFDATNGDMRFSQYYYLTGKLGALTVAREWFYENGTLYFWQQNGGLPTGVEYKARNWAFDLSNRSGIKIIGLRFKGCEINGNKSTSNIVIDGIRAEYLNHTFLQEGPDNIYYNPRQTGFKLYGTGNVVKNSEIKYAASNGIELGTGGRVENNLIEWISYEGNYGAPVLLHDQGDGHKILNNTFRNLGRSAIDCGYVNMGRHQGLEVAYNDMYNFGMLSSDGGAFYAARYIDLSNSRLHHNWIHNSKALHTPSAGFDAGINAGIYYDQATGSNTTNDHNVLWDNRQCDIHISTGEPDRNLFRGKANIYNNTLVTKVTDNYQHGYFSYLNIVQKYYDVERNTIFRARNINVQGSNWVDAQNGQAPFDTQYCLPRTTDPLFVGGSEFNPTNVPSPQTYFQLKDNSPARGKGVAIPGINDADGDQKDIGAYPYGQPGWTAGYVPK